jgi:hypothetical protein
VSAKEANARHRVADAALADDGFAWSVLHDIENDLKRSSVEKILVLLRMQIERAGYTRFPTERPYVHCFVFQRHGDAA